MVYEGNIVELQAMDATLGTLATRERCVHRLFLFSAVFRVYIDIKKERT